MESSLLSRYVPDEFCRVSGEHKIYSDDYKSYFSEPSKRDYNYSSY
jgi:hypothetical protein